MFRKVLLLVFFITLATMASQQIFDAGGELPALSSEKSIKTAETVEITREYDDTIYYDDGNDASHWYGVNYWGVQFTPARECTVKAALIHITSAGGQNCTVSIRPDDGGSPGTPDETKDFACSEGWNAILLDSVNVYSGDFWITYYVPTASGGPLVSGDGAGGSRSYYSTDGNSWSNMSGNDSDFLIRAVGDYASYTHDIMAVSFSPQGFVDPGIQIAPQGVFENVGQSSEDFDVFCEISGGYSSSRSLTGIAPDSQVTVVFDSLTTDSGAVYNATIYSVLGTDVNPGNDTLREVFYSYYYPRTVVSEMFTATWCGYCPYAATAIHQLKNEVGDSLGVIEYHSSNSDPFYIAESATRMSYYGVGGYPTQIFDGTEEIVGGYAGVYNDYRNAFNTRKEIPSAFEIDLNIQYSSGSGEIYADVIPHGSIPAEWDTYLRYVLTETDIEYSWQSEDSLFWVVRDMLPNATGVSFTDAISDTQSFTIDAGWDENNCEIVVLVQDDATGEVLQGGAIMVTSSGIEDENEEFSTFEVSGVYPNPALSGTNVEFIIPEKSRVSIKINDIAGRMVKNVFDGIKEAGNHTIPVEMEGLTSGIYFLRVENGNKTATKKFTLIR